MALTKAHNRMIEGAPINVRDYGAKGDGVTDDTAAINAWLTYLATDSSLVGYAAGAFAISTTISVPVTDLNIQGNATFIASGAQRLNMIVLSGCTGTIHIDGITVDGNNIVARPFEIFNTSSTTKGNVFLGCSTRFINAKTISPNTWTASACRIQGNFDQVVFAGEIDGVDNTNTSGAISVGFWADWTSTYFVDNVIVTSTAKIKNVKNSNTVTADADGIQRMGPTTEHLSFTVEPGAYFENCKGRSIKSQVTNNSINSPVIVRNAYDGVTEIDLQYSGGYIKGARIYYDGVNSNIVLSATARLNLPSNMTMADNTLTITNAPATETAHFCFFWGVDNTNAITQDHLICNGNRVVGGAVDSFATFYGANVTDTNRITIKDNYAEAISVSFLTANVVFNTPAKFNIIFECNNCKSSCTGITLLGSAQITVESDRLNRNISPIATVGVQVASGVLTLVGGNLQRVANEGGAGFDNIDTISGGSYSDGEIVIFKMANSGQAPKFKHGTGNIFLAGSTDFELNNLRDRLTLVYDSTADEWLELFRSDNS